MKKTAIAWILSVAGLAATIPQLAHALNAQQVVDVIAKQGLVAPTDLGKTAHYWSAKATTQEGLKTYVLIHDGNGDTHIVRQADLGTRYPGAAQVVAHLQAQGFAQVDDLEFDDGFWEADVRQHPGALKQELLLHPVTLEVVLESGPAHNPHTPGAARLTAAQVVSHLQAAGYTRITDVEWDDGVWEAEATNARRQRVELKIHPETGAVLREKLED